MGRFGGVDLPFQASAASPTTQPTASTCTPVLHSTLKPPRCPDPEADYEDSACLYSDRGDLAAAAGRLTISRIPVSAYSGIRS